MKKTGSNFLLMLVNKFDLVVFDHARGQTSGKWLWYGWNAFRKYFLGYTYDKFVEGH